MTNHPPLGVFEGVVHAALGGGLHARHKRLDLVQLGVGHLQVVGAGRQAGGQPAGLGSSGGGGGDDHQWRAEGGYRGCMMVTVGTGGEAGRQVQRTPTPTRLHPHPPG